MMVSLRSTTSFLGLAGLVLFQLVGGVRASEPASKVRFDREIRPLLSDQCFSCHGPDEQHRKAGLRLDTKDGAFAKLPSGEHAVVAGEPDDSALLFRVESDDPSLHMPPKASGKQLSPQQIDLLRNWVEQGAAWTTHWAFVPPTKPEVPPVLDASWSRSEIDRFLLARLESEDLKPAPEADKATLIRRVSLDLTGLPPTPQEVDAFLSDSSPDAYEKLVDRLMGSPRFGEHLARFWLDGARYGDTHGLHLDNYREIWPYRDWVINAFNANKPYDQFLVEQLAGDLLPDPTRDQLIATGFNRCHVSTNEGGSIEEEVYVRNILDQVDTNGTLLLGMTIACARCHDHKYDPVRSKDYYSLFAFFNNIAGPPMDGNASKWAPFIPVPTAEQAAVLKAADEKRSAIQKGIADALSESTYDDSHDAAEPEVAQRSDYVWIEDALPPGAKPTNEGHPSPDWEFVTSPESPVLSGQKSFRKTCEGLSQFFFTDAKPALRTGDGDTLFAYVYIDPAQPPKEIMLQWFTQGWSHRAYWGENVIDFGKDGTPERVRIGDLPPPGQWVRLEVDVKTLGMAPATSITGWAFTQFGGTTYWDKAGIATVTPQEGQLFATLTAWVCAQKASQGAGLPQPVQDAIKIERTQRTAEQTKLLRDYFLEHAYSQTQDVFRPLHNQLDQAEQERRQIEESIPTTLVFGEKEGEPKPAYLLNRGEYDQKRDRVERATPAFLPPLPPDAPKNRLGFARWLVAPNHPLTARVAVNRFWQQVFGTGIVKTSEDFGSQGEPPSHPELLDWLAVQFREDGWDVKHLIKRMVTSAAYRQRSQVTPEKLAKDPANRLLSRGPRLRLDAETLRDQALFASGLLVEKVGGPSVKPPQPAGLWEAVGYTSSNTAKFVADSGTEKVYRRSLYTFWKRTSPPPQMTTFDAPSREACQVRRERTNTPLQALLMMNEPQMMEASRALGERALHQAGETTEQRLIYLFRLVTGRPPEPAELTELSSTYNDLLSHYQAQAEAAKQLILAGETKPDPALDPSELAAWTMIGNVLLNLDEVINKG